MWFAGSGEVVESIEWRGTVEIVGLEVWCGAVGEVIASEEDDERRESGGGV
jgi:hypothetical protein